MKGGSAADPSPGCHWSWGVVQGCSAASLPPSLHPSLPPSLHPTQEVASLCNSGPPRVRETGETASP